MSSDTTSALPPPRADVRVEELFDALAELSEADAAARLEVECGGDASVRAEVARLLAHHRVAADFLTPIVEKALVLVATAEGNCRRRPGQLCLGR